MARNDGPRTRWRQIALAAAMLTVALPALAAQSARPPSLPAPTEQAARIPDALLPRVNASFAADDPAYTVAALPDDATMLQATNPAHRLTTTFASDGIAFSGESGPRWSLRLAAVGADGVTQSATPVASGARVEYRRGNVTEWYLNGPLGVEQGFTVAAPPTSGDTLALTLSVGGGATPRLDVDAVTLTLPGGEAFQYGHLVVTDAVGRRLPARLSVTNDAIAITTDLAGAVYPVTVDPLVQTKKLIASDGAAGDAFGISVAMSADGARVVVGASRKTVGVNTAQGAAYLYSGVNYATEKRLTASDGAANDYFGTAVAMSADGAAVIVGAYNKKIGANTQQGAAYVYSGANYATEKRLTASDGAASNYFGYSVAMSGDGTQVVVGAPAKNVGANAQQGVAYIYSGANYATEKKLLASDGAASDYFGDSVAMSGDGTRVIAGADNKNIGTSGRQGAAYVYSGTNYATERRLVAGDGTAGDHFGFSVAMSGDGTKVVVGASYKTVGTHVFQGAAYAYSGANYATEKKLLASDGADLDYFGSSVTMSGDGTTVIVGMRPGHTSEPNISPGAAYAYSGANFATEQKLLASDGVVDDRVGHAVAISADGTKVVVGAYNKNIGANTRQGAAYIYGASGGTPAPLPPIPAPTGPPQVGPPAPLPTPKTGGGPGGSPNPLPQARP